MDRASLVFPAAEFESRLARLQQRMALDHLEALLLTAPSDIFYVTGFLTRFWESPARPWFVIVPASGEPVAVIPSIGRDLMGKTWITDIRTWDAPDPFDDGVTLLSQTLSDVTPEGARIGLPMGLETHLRMPLADFHKVGTRIGTRRFVDATQTVQPVREVKTEREIEKIEAACAIAGRAFDQVPVFAAQGQPLDTVFRRFQIALLEQGADWVSYTAGGAGRDGYGDVISPAPAVPLQKGDILMLDTGAVKDGYFCDFDRNYSVGPISGEAKRVHEALWLATEHVIETLTVGMRARDVHGLLVGSLEKSGVTAGGGRLGHGLGVTLTEWPSFTPLDTTELVAGMVLTIEPGAMVREGTYIVHEENILLTENGVRLLSPRAPFDMIEV